MRMHAGRPRDEAAGRGSQVSRRAGAFQRLTNADKAYCSGVASPGNHGIAVGIKGRIHEMRV